MKVITEYPVYVNRKKVGGQQDWLAFDSNGKPTNSAETKIFQDWLDAKYPTWLNGGKLNKGSGYGKYPFGPSTSKAWNAYGTQFVTEAKATIGAVQNVIAPPVVPAGTTPTAAQVEDAKKKGLTWDSVQGAFVKAKESGIFDTILGLFGKKQESTTPGVTAGEIPAGTVPTAGQEQPKTGMSKGMKIALIGGGVVLVGVLIFALTRNKNGNK